ncbi:MULTISPECIES: DUF2281 domain-containing protein [Tepidiphilus]|uniref:DUF2281 domain-containing protein n=1 Tax=Tepidiphilus baoligensis TaxID=2698687 RepID=A0ABX1QK40_9PROT|nr:MULTISPECIES: DUF2281 domain-containing protein [Tepidiphilus]NMH16325.1 DUF2281 domain-containing protein [Tepidiphilus baoligensis]
MNLSELIFEHAKRLPPQLQQETLDFISWIERRHGIYVSNPARAAAQRTESFLAKIAGCLGEDFPDDIDDADLGVDVPRESLE